MDSRYPAFDVLQAKDEWDEHTREIVLQRIETGRHTLSLLDVYQGQLLKEIASHIIYDEREDILRFIAYHVDRTIQNNAGEDQRKAGIPPEKDLIITGLGMVDKLSQGQFLLRFIELEKDKQTAVLGQLAGGIAPVLSGWDSKLQTAFFKKILALVVSAYYSYPTVWSEIGYAGPAYPRGYVRSELGLTDPWEARHD
ncbi:gluconate 2-dehydrogenase subunit 3 family protein [Aneurinibacillus tyrosinisolvens]|uniref:gluconate 2-dehydrogenase subunit 3 family protein n=1 Tax=Aneurinibacillus tyrosinisolvens TaxID=1443435 RepID=UPI00063FB56F|nr:gluconate 2-dehydrogenase subunit 3 family protein [Aneurinibacillus tyrosinisolvens]